jgi:1-acyl-sn-glycerol-3-phosphate acyltransferase
VSERFARHEEVANPGVPSAFAVRFLGGLTHSIVRVTHRASLGGTEHLPEKGPFLLIGNHPMSLGVAEFTSFMALYAKRFGATRPLAGFAHAASFGWWPLSWVFRHIGAIPSTYRAAEETLVRGVPVVLFPGGDYEGFRPFWKASTVDFGGRLGFLRIAHRAWVPIVPMAFRGRRCGRVSPG